ncbi:hypothetical protein JCM11251_003264 [Rhodosporidiobolus azoricus]
MDWLASRVDDLAKQASELTVYDLKSAVNKAKAYALNLTEYEQKVREATNDDPWGASSTLMQDIAQGTFNFQLFNEIMPTIYSRFTEKEARQWRQIYKGLVLLEYLIKNGSERVIDDARSHLSLIRVLRNFHYIDENGKDQGINVRNRAKELGELLNDLDRVRMERRKAKANRNKYTGVGNDGFGGGGGGGGPSFTSASGSRYGGFGSDSYNSGGGGDGFSGGGSGGFSDSRGANNEFEEYDAGDDEDRAPQRGSTSYAASPSSRSASSRAANSHKPTPEPPKPAPQPEVNLFDFDDDDEQQPVPPPKYPASVPSAAAPSASLDDDFDDFQSAAPLPPNPSAPSAPAATAAHQNVFDLLKPQAAPPRNSSSTSSFPAAPAFAAQAQPSASIPSRQPAYSQSALQPTSASSTASLPAAAPAASAPPQKKPADDFSDLFGAFGSTPASSSAGAAKSAGGSGQTMAQIAAQKRQDQLFAMGGGAKPAAGGSMGGNDGWDSLL